MLRYYNMCFQNDKPHSILLSMKTKDVELIRLIHLGRQWKNHLN